MYKPILDSKITAKLSKETNYMSRYYGYIYKITNDFDEKVYIGQTTRTVELRFRDHLKQSAAEDRKSLHLYTAMNKYGKEHFKVDTIDTADNQTELNEKERYWIKHYDSIENGYNILEGGNDINPMSSTIVKNKHDIKMRSTETRSKISKTMRVLRTTVGFSETHKQRIRESRVKRKLERAARGLSFYEHPENLASRSKAVFCILDTGEKFEFKSILDAGKWWYTTYKPFGPIYSTATYQRKIESSIAGNQIEYGCKTHKKYKIITNIKWYYVV